MECEEPLDLKLGNELLDRLRSLPRQPEDSMIDHGVSEPGVSNINCEEGMHGIEVDDPKLGVIKYIPGSVAGNILTWNVWIVQASQRQTLFYMIEEDGTVDASRTDWNDPDTLMNPEKLSEMSQLELALRVLGDLPADQQKIVNLNREDSTSKALVDLEKLPTDLHKLIKTVLAK